MKEYIDLLIEEKWKKWDEFANFILAVEKLPSTNEKNITLQQGNGFIDVYMNLFGNHYGQCIKDLLTLSITGTPVTASNFNQYYIGVTDPDKTKLNIGMCEVHKCNLSKTRWRNFALPHHISQRFWRGSNCFPQIINGCVYATLEPVCIRRSACRTYMD